MPTLTFDVERDGVIVATGLTEPTFPDTGLTASTEYTYRVRVRDEYGVGPWSAAVAITTEAAGFTDNFDYASGAFPAQSGGVWVSRSASAGVVANDGSPQWTVGLGSLSLNIAGSYNAQAAVVSPGPLGTDYDVSTELFVITLDAIQASRIGLLTRYDQGIGETRNYIGVFLERLDGSDGAPNRVVIRRTSGATDGTQLTSQTITELAAPAVLTVQVRGNNYTVLVDETPVITDFEVTDHASNTDVGIVAVAASGANPIEVSFNSFSAVPV